MMAAGLKGCVARRMPAPREACPSSTHLGHGNVNGNGGATQAVAAVADHALDGGLRLKRHKPKPTVLLRR